MPELYDTVTAEVRDPRAEPDTDVGGLDEKRGLKLIDHFHMYGASEAELKRLDDVQVTTLESAGLLTYVGE